jgi:hypothetical protein
MVPRLFVFICGPFPKTKVELQSKQLKYKNPCKRPISFEVLVVLALLQQGQVFKFMFPPIHMYR